MIRWPAGRAEEFADGVRQLVELGSREVVVMRQGDAFHAYENTCPHAGGPVGEGIIIGKVRVIMDEGRRILREEFDEDTPQLICPWHGWAFDLATGVCAGRSSIRLRRYDVEVESGVVYVCS